MTWKSYKMGQKNELQDTSIEKYWCNQSRNEVRYNLINMITHILDPFLIENTILVQKISQSLSLKPFSLTVEREKKID